MLGRRQVLDEFIECIVRVAFEKDPLKHLSDFKDGVPTVRTNRRPKFRSALVFCLLRDLTAVWIDPTPMDTVILWPDGARWSCFPKSACAGPESDSCVLCQDPELQQGIADALEEWLAKSLKKVGQVRSNPLA